MTTKTPFHGTRLTQFLEVSILKLRGQKTQGQIATEAGFRSPNMLAMIKRGASRLPLDRVAALAKALEVDPAHLLLLALEQMMGSTEAAALMAIMSNFVTDHEMDWVKEIRRVSGLTDPPLTRRGRAAILSVFGK